MPTSQFPLVATVSVTSDKRSVPLHFLFTFFWFICRKNAGLLTNEYWCSTPPSLAPPFRTWPTWWPYRTGTRCWRPCATVATDPPPPRTPSRRPCRASWTGWTSSAASYGRFARSTPSTRGRSENCRRRWPHTQKLPRREAPRTDRRTWTTERKRGWRWKMHFICEGEEEVQKIKWRTETTVKWDSSVSCVCVCVFLMEVLLQDSVVILSLKSWIFTSAKVTLTCNKAKAMKWRLFMISWFPHSCLSVWLMFTSEEVP